MSGFPLRPDRDNYGPDPENAAPVRDARRQISADIFRLIFHQVSGMGLTNPRTVLAFTGQVGPTIQARAEAWNPKRLTTGAYADPTITRTAAGNYLVSYPTPVPDEAGDDQVISFSWALAFPINADPLILKHAQAAVQVSTNQLRVGIYNAAGALEDGNQILLAGW